MAKDGPYLGKAKLARCKLMTQQKRQRHVLKCVEIASSFPCFSVNRECVWKNRKKSMKKKQKKK